MESSKIDTELFKVIEDKARGLRLILPQFETACSNSIWNDNNKWFRSRVETLDGQTVSQGLGKFFNLGQSDITIESIANLIREGRRVVATLKLDGSLLCRSVYKGKVMFRTRGSLDYHFHDDAEEEMQFFIKKYPKLNDPELFKSTTLLFEWTTPKAQIVIRYPEPALTLIGAVGHGHRHVSHLTYSPIEHLEVMARVMDVPMVQYFQLNDLGDWYNLLNNMKSNSEIEGYVLRIHGDQILIKVKADSYVARHSLKSNLSFKSIMELWLQCERKPIDFVIDQLRRQFDDEVMMWCLPFLLEFERAACGWNRDLDNVRKLVTEHQIINSTRKDFAIAMKKTFAGDNTLFSLAMQLWQGREVTDQLVRNYMERFNAPTK